MYNSIENKQTRKHCRQTVLHPCTIILLLLLFVINCWQLGITCFSMYHYCCYILISICFNSILLLKFYSIVLYYCTILFYYHIISYLWKQTIKKTKLVYIGSINICFNNWQIIPVIASSNSIYIMVIKKSTFSALNPCLKLEYWCI